MGGHSRSMARCRLASFCAGVSVGAATAASTGAATAAGLWIAAGALCSCSNTFPASVDRSRRRGRGQITLTWLGNERGLGAD
jgi:hypothetical protein